MKPTLIPLIFLCTLLLGGCNNTFPPARPLELSGPDYQADEFSSPAIVMDTNSNYHIARAECRLADGSACRAIYESGMLGGRLDYRAYQPEEGHSLRYPDIAIATTNVAFMVWLDCPAGGLDSRLCSTQWMRSDQPDNIHTLDEGYYNLTPPLVVVNGATVYAVHEVAVVEQGSALRYCEIGDPDYACHWVSEDVEDGARRTDFSAVVSDTGSLHAAWLEYGGGYPSLYYADNDNNHVDDMSIPKNLGTFEALAPAITIVHRNSTGPQVYVFLASQDTPSDRIHSFDCVAADCTELIHATLNLPAAEEWKISGKLSVNNDTQPMPSIAFAAETTQYPGETDIYSVSFVRDYPDNEPILVNDSAQDGLMNDCEPVVINNPFGYPAVGWRICGMENQRGNVYYDPGINYEGFPRIRLIHQSNFNGRSGLDADLYEANTGTNVAGTWNEFQKDGRLATWLAYNSAVVFLPLISQ